MSVLFIIAPIALLLAAIAIGAFIWAARDGQFEDTETAAHRMLFDDVRSDRLDDKDDRELSDK